MPDDPHKEISLAREAMFKAEAAHQMATIVDARFDERSKATDRRLDSVDETLRQQREEAKAEHREQQETVTALGERQREANAKMLTKVDDLATAVGQLQSAGATKLKERELSTTVKVSIITVFGGGSIAGLIQLLVANHS